MSIHAAEPILALFNDTATAFTLERAQRLAEEIAAHGGLDRAIAALVHDQASACLDDALAYRALLAQAGQPRAAIERSLRQARDLDARAEPAWADAASLHGQAAYRRKQGELYLAETLLAQACAAERFAAKLEEQAFALRLRAADLQAYALLHATLFDVAA
jgi:hypothetical protein